MPGEFPSLDGMSVDELKAVKVQLRFVAGTINEMVIARELRLAGQVDRALKIEAIVERRINMGPDWAKY
jgi:hypothetical protein